MKQVKQINLSLELIQIKTRSVAHALKIFETINDRGKGLDAMDLLKNLMFMQVSNTTDWNKDGPLTQPAGSAG